MPERASRAGILASVSESVLERVGVTVPPLVGAGLRSFGARVEELGFASAWTNDQYHSAFVGAAVIAATTTRIEVGTAAVQAFARTPLATATGALDLAALSGGRFRLGLASGVRRLVEGWHGVRYDRPAARLREYAAVVTALMARLPSAGALRWKGEFFDIDISGYEFPHPDVMRPPVYLSGVRSGMVAMAAEVADGFIGHPAYTPGWIEAVVRPAIQSGSKERAPNRPALRLIARATAVVGEDAGAVRESAALHVAVLARARAYEDLFAQAGFGALAEVMRREPDQQAAARLATDASIEAFTLAGTAGEVAEKLAVRLRGVDQLVLSPPQHVTAATFLDALTALSRVATSGRAVLARDA